MEKVKSLPVVEFQDGLVIQSTSNYDVVYGYKDGLEGQKGGQRVFLVPKNHAAEAALTRFATENENLMVDKPTRTREKEGFKAIRFNGPVTILLESLNGDQDQGPGAFGSGVPSLKVLESKLG